MMRPQPARWFEVLCARQDTGRLLQALGQTGAVELEAPGLVIEFETLPPMTENPAWGLELTQILLEGLETGHARHGLKSVLRLTPNDTREMERPPRMRSGRYFDAMIETFSPRLIWLGVSNWAGASTCPRRTGRSRVRPRNPSSPSRATGHAHRCHPRSSTPGHSSRPGWCRRSSPRPPR